VIASWCGAPRAPRRARRSSGGTNRSRRSPVDRHRASTLPWGSASSSPTRAPIRRLEDDLLRHVLSARAHPPVAAVAVHVTSSHSIFGTSRAFSMLPRGLARCRRSVSQAASPSSPRKDSLESPRALTGSRSVSFASCPSEPRVSPPLLERPVAAGEPHFEAVEVPFSRRERAASDWLDNPGTVFDVDGGVALSMRCARDAPSRHVQVDEP